MTSVLVVDDEPAICRLLSAVIQQELRVDVLGAGDAESALDLAQSHPPDLIVSDVKLPGQSGVQLTEHLREDARFSNLPIILMSAYDEPGEHEADYFFTKPLDLERLISLIQELLPGITLG